MTLDEAINHAEEVTELHENRCNYYTEHDIPECMPPSVKCANEHRQLAAWLKELRMIRDKVANMDGSEDFAEYVKGIFNGEK